MLAGPRAGDRHAAAELGEAYMKTARWMRALRQRSRAGAEPRRPGRPRLGEDERARVRALIEEQRRIQGRRVGSPAILEALSRSQVKVSRMLVEQELAAVKRAERIEEGRRREAMRVSHELTARDAVWGEDTTHLGRLESGAKVEAEVVKDLATRETVGLRVGAVPTATDAIGLLEQTAQERGGWPLVWMADPGSINRDVRLRAVLERERTIHLLSRVHTPTDNASTERQHLDLKGEAELGRGVRLESEEEARERAQDARRRIDEGRLRASLGWRTAAQVGRALARADALVEREEFYRVACSAMARAAQRHADARAAQGARREALFQTLLGFGLAVRHVGPRPRVRPGPTPCSATADRVECPGA